MRGRGGEGLLLSTIVVPDGKEHSDWFSERSELRYTEHWDGSLCCLKMFKSNLLRMKSTEFLLGASL